VNCQESTPLDPAPPFAGLPNGENIPSGAAEDSRGSEDLQRGLAARSDNRRRGAEEDGGSEEWTAEEWAQWDARTSTYLDDMSSDEADPEPRSDFT
jgi:hypothetical protein